MTIKTTANTNAEQNRCRQGARMAFVVSSAVPSAPPALHFGLLGASYVG